MKEYIILNIPLDEINNNPLLKESLTKYSVETIVKHSDLAVETFSAVLQVADFIVALLAFPYIAQLIDQNKISVSFNGFNMKDNCKNIIRDICKEPGIKEEFINAFKNHEVNIQGKSSKVIQFYSEVKEVLGLEEDSEGIGE